MRSGRTFVFETALEKADFAPEGDSCLRVLAGGRTFFARRGQFVYTAGLAELRPGTAVRIGCHALDGGAFWLHWLTADRNAVLEPRPAACSRKLMRELKKTKAGTAAVPPPPPPAKPWQSVPDWKPDPVLERPFAAGAAENITLTVQEKTFSTGETMKMQFYRFRTGGRETGWLTAEPSARKVIQAVRKCRPALEPFFSSLPATHWK